MPDFSSLINTDTVIERLEAETWEEVLTKTAEYLQERGYVSSGYREMLVNRERNFPTGLPTEPFHVAIPHTDPKCVIKPCVLICRLAHPVAFRDMGGDGVVQAEYSIGLVIQKKAEQTDLIQWVIDIFSDEERMERLRTAHTKEEIVNAICTLAS